MQYLVESIGAKFSDKDAKTLAALLTQRSSEGYKFHSVFQVEQPGGCTGGKGEVTYLAVYEKEESPIT